MRVGFSTVSSIDQRKNKCNKDLCADECPHPYTLPGFDGELFPCGRRLCPHVPCREIWSRKQFRILNEEHIWNPFDRRVSLHPPKGFSDLNKLLWCRELLQSLQQWCRDNPNEYFDCHLFPDKHGKQPLHWSGPGRCSKGAYKQLKCLMRLRKAKVKCHYNNVPLKDFTPQIEYACGKRWQHEIIPVRIEKKRMLICSGKPFRNSKGFNAFALKMRRLLNCHRALRILEATQDEVFIGDDEL